MGLLDKTVTKYTHHINESARYCIIGTTSGLDTWHTKGQCHVPTVTKKDRRIHWYRQKDKAVSVHAVKAYIASGSIAPLILNLGIGCRYVVNITPRPFYPPVKDLQYPPNMRLG
jgi:hypothetical protein